MDREEGDPEGTTRSPEVDPPVTTSLIMSSIDRNWVTTEGVFHSNAKTKVLQKARDSVRYRMAGNTCYPYILAFWAAGRRRMGVLLFARCMFGDPHAGTGIGAPRAARPSGRAPGSEPECIGGNGIAGDCCCLLLTGRDTRGGDAADGGAAVGCPRGRAPAASAPVAFGTGLAPTALIVGVGRAAASWGLCACVFWGRGANAPTGVCAGAAKPDPRAGAWGMGKPDGAGVAARRPWGGGWRRAESPRLLPGPPAVSSPVA